jgi:hypothetical protein
VADKSGLTSDESPSASHIDSNLLNPWGLAIGGSLPAWVADEGSNAATLYDGLGDSIPLVVQLPSQTSNPAGSQAAEPTGVVFNAGGSGDFVIGSGANAGPATFIFDGLDGVIYGWSQAAGAVIAESASNGAEYTGLAFATSASGNVIYAADFKNGQIDVFSNAFKLVSGSGSFPFTDPKLPAGYAPYGIQAVSNAGTTQILVAYAANNVSTLAEPTPYAVAAAGTPVRQIPAALNVSGLGMGQVDAYDVNGNLLKTLVPAGGVLNGPWGMALAPSGFGSIAGDLLVGNFGDGFTDNGSGAIDVFDPSSGAFLGALADGQGNALAIPGLWSLQFGNGAQSQPLTTLFFTAGTTNEANGSYGRIDAGSSAPAFTSAAAITSPAAGATVSGTTPVTISVQDINAVSQVQYFANGTAIGTVSTAPFTLPWDTTTIANGAVSLTAAATDVDNNTVNAAAVSVTVSNAAATPAVTLEQVQAIFDNHGCGGCHTGASANTGNASCLPGCQNLNDGATYSNVVNVPSLETPSLDRILPNQPGSSYLVDKIMGVNLAPGTVRMPQGCGSQFDPCLSAAEISTVTAWVNEGAPNN